MYKPLDLHSTLVKPTAIVRSSSHSLPMPLFKTILTLSKKALSSPEQITTELYLRGERVAAEWLTVESDNTVEERV